MRKFFNKKLFTYILAYQTRLFTVFAENAIPLVWRLNTVNFISASIGFFCFDIRAAKNRDSFLRLRGLQALIFIYAASLQSFPALWQSERH